MNFTRLVVDEGFRAFYLKVRLCAPYAYRVKREKILLSLRLLDKEEFPGQIGGPHLHTAAHYYKLAGGETKSIAKRAVRGHDWVGLVKLTPLQWNVHPALLYVPNSSRSSEQRMTE